MKKHIKFWIITASALMLVGGLMFLGVMTMLDWNFEKLSTVNFETNAYEINENYINISVTTDTANLEFVPSDSKTTLVECFEQKNMKHSVKTENGNLVIKVIDQRKWYEYIGISFKSPKITIAIPADEYENIVVKEETGNILISKELKFKNIDISASTGNVKNYASASGDIKIKTSTGNIHTENLSAKSVDFATSTGSITLVNLNCTADITLKVSTGNTKLDKVSGVNITSKGTTGNLTLKNVKASGKLSCTRDTGAVKFDGSDATEIFVQTSTGSVSGNLLTDKIFIAQTDTGRINLPKTTKGGKCEITTDTGNINITVD